VVHLVREHNGEAPFAAFLDSYRAHAAGADHDLVLLLKGFSSERAKHRYRALADDVPHVTLVVGDGGYDLGSYVEAARRLSHERLCFVNSYSRILCDGWLGHLDAALSLPGTAMVGATGSWESHSDWRRGSWRVWPLLLRGIRAARRDFPRFPNPHLRSNGFEIERARWLELTTGPVLDKRRAYMLESGYHSVTRRLLDQGLRVLIVDRAGTTYDVPSWPASRTFRAGHQEGLMIADNQTDSYLASPPASRRLHSRAAWGRAARRL
jgi:hypothetical protein